MGLMRKWIVAVCQKPWPTAFYIIARGNALVTFFNPEQGIAVEAVRAGVIGDVSQVFCRNDGPIMGGKHFDYPAKLTEIILLDELAQRFNTRIEWDAKSGRVINHPELTAFVRKPAREGWNYGEDLWKQA